MRRLIPVAAIVLAACGEPSVAERIDAMRGKHYLHHTLPSPERRAELHPGTEQDLPSLETQLRENEHGRALLDAGAAAVPELVKLLQDNERCTLAAVFLAEIGGVDAADGLLQAWRRHRERAKTKSVYFPEGTVIVKGGYTHDGVDSKFYGELLHALCYAGGPVSAAIADDTQAAIREAERLLTAGVELLRSERGELNGSEAEFRWNVEPVETACEGLQVLAMVGATEAAALFEQGLRSPVRGPRWTALQNVTYLGRDAQPLLPTVAALLDHPDWQWREMALEALELLYREGLTKPKTDEEWRALASQWKRRVLDEPLPR